MNGGRPVKPATVGPVPTFATRIALLEWAHSQTAACNGDKRKLIKAIDVIRSAVVAHRHLEAE